MSFKRPNAKFCHIATDDNSQFVCMPDGTRIPGQVWTRVTDPLDEYPYVIVKVLVNIEKPEAYEL